MRVEQGRIGIPAERLRAFNERLFTAAGLAPADATVMADTLVFADLRGTTTHGVARVRSYIESLRSGRIKARPAIRVIKQLGGVAWIDGDHGPGQVSGAFAMNLAIEKAREHGIALCGVINGGHIGALAYWTTMALAQGMIGLSASNGTAIIPPWGAREAALSSVPLSISAPAAERFPLVLDMALSVTARGNVILAAKRGEKIPPGWALDRHGRPTEDPQEALDGSLLPIAEYKGSGLAVMMEALCAVLLGGTSSIECGDLAPGVGDPQKPLGFNNLYGAVSIEAFEGPAVFARKCDGMIDALKALPKAEGQQEILMPGEIQYRIAREREAAGIPLDTRIVEELNDLARAYGLAPLA